MRKSQLRKIEIQPWKPGQVSTCATNLYMVTCQKMESGVIFAFYRFQTEGYEHTPYAVMFCEEYDFTTYFPGADWWSDSSVFSASNEAKGSLSDIFSGLYYGWKTPEAKTIFASVKDKKTAESFLRHYHDKPVNDYLSDYQVSKLPDPWGSFIRYQSYILELRKNKRHRKANEKREKLFSILREPGPGFANWVWNTAMSQFQYGFYTPQGSTKVELSCSVCQETKIVRKADIKGFGRKKTGVCPFCGKSVIFLPKSVQKRWWIDTKHVSIMQKTSNGGFVFRDFIARRAFSKDKLPVHIDELDEASRWFVSDTSNTGYILERGWKERTDGWFYEQSLYPRTVKNAVKGTKYERCGITELVQSGWSNRYSLYLWRVSSHPVLEKVVKAGFDTVMKGYLCPDSYYRIIHNVLNDKGNDLYEALRLPREEVRRVRRLGFTDNLCAIELLQKAANGHVRLKDKDISEIMEAEINTSSTETLFRCMNRTHLSAHKMVKYFIDQKDRFKAGYYSNVNNIDVCIREYEDYLDMMEYLGFSLSDRGNTLHPNLLVALARITEQYNAQIDEERKREEAERNKNYLVQMMLLKDQIMRQEGAEDIFRLKTDELILKPLWTPDELIAEGKALHNCIGTYLERVAKGKTMVLAVRKTENPDVPYCAFEFRDGRIVQVRLDHNASAPEEVEKFADSFAKKMEKSQIHIPQLEAAAA